MIVEQRYARPELLAAARHALATLSYRPSPALPARPTGADLIHHLAGALDGTRTGECYTRDELLRAARHHVVGATHVPPVALRRGGRFATPDLVYHLALELQENT